MINLIDEPELCHAFLNNCTESKEVVKGRCALEGNVSTIEAFYEGSPQDVTREANAILELFGNRGGLILSSACEIPRHSPEINVRALTDAARNYPY